ncbi:MAG TPA: TlyA family RNA methyltransferase, partial [Symbiobacteriaceae bacterium]|nr:TlyA family RNA methyltransferase [Symbiobacteriaceae bacterium]
QRLDQALASRGLVPSRERAQEAIKAGMVLVNGRPATRSAQPVTETDELQVTGDPIGYVGRGGLKLEAALDAFFIDPTGQVCLDVGASTGGFTECLLRRGASQVFALDVGRDQLHPSLRSDERIVVMEETDIRSLESLPVAPTLITVDVSFISLKHVLEPIGRLAAPEATVIALIKPQFEVGPGKVDRKGIVRDPHLMGAAIEGVVEAATTLGWLPGRVIPSPIKGTEGNLEYLTSFRLSRSGWKA